MALLSAVTSVSQVNFLPPRAIDHVIVCIYPPEREGARMRKREPVPLCGHRGGDPALTSHRTVAIAKALVPVTSAPGTPLTSQSRPPFMIAKGC